MSVKTFLLFFCFPVLLCAQNNQNLNIKIGFGYLYYRDIDEALTPLAYSPLSVGSQVSASYVVSLSGRLALEAGIGVERNNHFTVGYIPSGSVGLLQNQFTNIFVPLHLRIYSKKIKFFVSGGGFFSKVTSNKNTYYDRFEAQKGLPQYYIPGNAKELPQKDVFRSFNTGIDLGLGYIWRYNERFGFTVEVQTRIGLTDMNNKGNLFSYYSTKEVIKTFTPAIQLGFYYNFEPKPGS